VSRRLALTVAMLVALVTIGALSLSAYGEGRGGGDNEENDSDGPTRNGQIVFRRYFNADQTKGALFTMNPDGSHVPTPPRAGRTTFRRGLLMERGSPSSASRPTRARAGSWS